MKQLGVNLPKETKDFPGGVIENEHICKCWRSKRCWSDPWVGKIPWRRTWQSTSVFLPGESTWTKQRGWIQSIGSQRDGYN